MQIKFIITTIMNKQLIVSVAIVLGLVNVILAQPRRVIQLIDSHPTLVNDERVLDASVEGQSTTRADQRQPSSPNGHQDRDVKLSMVNENEQQQQEQQQRQQQQQHHHHQRQQLNDLNADNILPLGAPIGPDGRVIDTPAVAIAKAEHAAAHANQKVNLAKESARNAAATAATSTSGTIFVAIAPTPGLTYDTIYY